MRQRNQPTKQTPHAQDESFRDGIRNLFVSPFLNLVREHTAAWGREHLEEPFGPIVEPPDHCTNCGAPVAFVFDDRRGYVPVDVIKRHGYPWSDFPGYAVADLLSTHACAE